MIANVYATGLALGFAAGFFFYAVIDQIMSRLEARHGGEEE